LLLARTYSAVQLGSSSDWYEDGVGLLTKDKFQNESDEGVFTGLTSPSAQESK
jgi:hypothetical protein